MLLEQINVLRYQVFIVLNSHKTSLSLGDLVNCTDVRFLFQYAVELGLRGCHSNIRFGQSRSAWLTTKSVYTGVSEWASEWVTHLHIGVPVRNTFQCLIFKKVNTFNDALHLSFASYIFLSPISGNLNFLGHSKNVTFLSPAMASNYQIFALQEAQNLEAPILKLYLAARLC